MNTARRAVWKPVITSRHAYKRGFRIQLGVMPGYLPIFSAVIEKVMVAALASKQNSHAFSSPPMTYISIFLFTYLLIADYIDTRHMHAPVIYSPNFTSKQAPPIAVMTILGLIIDIRGYAFVLLDINYRRERHAPRWCSYSWVDSRFLRGR